MSERRLLLLRHAKSSWDDPALADVERPLAPRGRRACELIAAHLRETGAEPDLIVVSPAVRTRQTLERISPGLPSGTPVRTEPRVYEATAGELLALVNELPEEVGTAMLIGHNPGMQGLAIALAGAGEQGGLERLRLKYPTAALAALAARGEWRALAPGGASLESFVRPRELAAG